MDESFTNPVRTVGVLDVCLCWYRWGVGRERWGGVMFV